MSLEQLPAAAPAPAAPPAERRRRAPAGRRGRGDGRPLPVLRRDLLAAIAVDSPGADAAVVGRFGPSADHPVALAFPEGDYLKGLLIRKAGPDPA